MAGFVVLVVLVGCTPLSDLRRVSLDGAGQQVTNHSTDASISDDGRWVVFSSAATQYPGSNGRRQVYLKDLESQDVILVSANDSGGGSNGDNNRPVISGDGSRVAWHSAATDVRPAVDAHVGLDVWARDVEDGLLVGDPILVSAGSDGTSGTGSSSGPSITTTGEFIAFRSNDKSIVSVSSLVDTGVYLWDEGAGALSYISNGNLVNTGGGHPFFTRGDPNWLNNRTCNGSGGPGPDTPIRQVVLGRQAVSDDGRYVVFTGGWCGLGALGSSRCFGTYFTAAHFVHDRGTGSTIALVDCQVVHLAGHVYGTANVGSISPPAISPDGSTVVSPLGTGALLSNPSVSQIGALPIHHGNSFTDVDISENGDVVSFLTSASLADDDTGLVDVYLAGGRVVRASSLKDGLPNGATADARLSGGGEHLTFTSAASNLVGGDTNARSDVFALKVNRSLMGSASETAYGNPSALVEILPPETWACNPMQAFIDWCQGEAADPVNTFTGNYHETYTDLALPGRGGGLVVNRSYNSAGVDRVGMFGPGWSTNLDMELRFEDDGIVVVRQEGGAESRFLSYGGGFVTSSRVLGSLEPGAGGSYVLTRPSQERFTFDADGRLIGQVDTNGHGLSFSYDGSGRLSSIGDGSGRELVVTWDGSRIAVITDPVGRSVEYGYDAAGNLATVTDIDGGEWRYGYDDAHRMTSVVSPRQVAEATFGALVNEYDSSGRVARQIDPEGGITVFDYHSQPGATRVIDPDGEVRVDTYDEGLRTERTLAAGTSVEATWTYEYHPEFKAITRVVGPDAVADQEFTYDDNGNVASVVDALGRTSEFTYDRNRRVTSSTDPAGVRTTYAYDQYGNLTNHSTPIAETGGVRATTYTRATAAATRGDITRITDPMGQRVDMVYDQVTGLTTSTTNRLGHRFTQAYDQVGRIQWSVSPKGNATGADPDDFRTTYVTDAAGRVTGVADPLGNSASTTYDANGNAQTITDALGQTTEFHYNQSDQPVGVTHPDATTTSTTYDAEGQVSSTIDRDGRTTTFVRDPLDRVTAVTGTDDRTTSYTLDIVGNAVQVQLPGGNCSATPAHGCITNDYDDAGQVTATSYSDPATANITYTYGPRGELTAFTDGTGTTTYTYDSLGRRTGAQDGTGATTSYEWNTADLLTATVYPNGNRVTRTYDLAGRLTRVTDWAYRQYNYAYDQNSNITGLTYPSGSSNVDAYVYDNADRLDSITYRRGSTELAAVDIDISPIGLIGATETTGLPDGPQAFTYDPLGQLTGADGDSYTYDLAGNPTSLADGTRQVFDGANQLCFTAPTGVTGGSCATPPTGATRYLYGNRGQRTAKIDPAGTGSLYLYDEADQLTTVHTAPEPGVIDTHHYTYDARGIRQTATHDSNTRQSTWSHIGLPRLLTETQDGDTTSWVYGAGTTPLAQYDPDGTVHYLHADQIGSVRVVTATNGNPTATSTWDAYGNHLESTGSPNTPFGFAGAYTDHETGFLYLRARYYDPATAQFITRDPLELLTGSPYGYVDNSPLNGTDPTGLAPGLGEPDRHNDLKQNIANVAGGVLDSITFQQWRRSDYLTSRVDMCSPAFGGGQVLGMAIDIAIGTKGAKSGVGTIRGKTGSKLSDDILRRADANLTGSGETVLGHYADDYIGLAKRRNASYYDIGDAWDGLTAAQRWAANRRVLDAAILNRDRIVLATARHNIRYPSALADEIQYLVSNGYKWVDDKTLVPG